MVIGCALSASFLAQFAHAEGNGVITLSRDVQARQATRLSHPDPYPSTVNTNASGRIVAQTNNNELSDGDFAGIASGATVNRLLVPDAGGGVRGLNAVPTSLPGVGGGSSTGSGGGGISNTVNQSVQRGLGALQILGGK